MCPEKFASYRLLVMTKSPEPGKVKTRMQPHLTQQESVDLHIALTRYALSQWQSVALCPIDIWLGGDREKFHDHIIAEDEKYKQLKIYPQVNGDLGNRMSAAVNTIFSDPATKGIILVGTDCPFIDKGYLEQALLSLHNGHDVVIGPAYDGGYVLLGMNNYYPELFVNIDWGNENVFADTVSRITSVLLNYSVLKKQHDIDTKEDLALLDQEGFSEELQAFAHKVVV